MADAQLDREIHPLLRLLNRKPRPAPAPPAPDPVQELETRMNELTEELTTLRAAAIRDFLLRVPHRYCADWTGSVHPPCLCGKSLNVPSHGPLGTLLDTSAWMARVDAGDIDWQSLPGDLASVPPELLGVGVDVGRHGQAAKTPEDAGEGEIRLPPGVLGYLVAMTDAERDKNDVGTTHTILMSLGAARREARSHGASARYTYFPVEVRRAAL